MDLVSEHPAAWAIELYVLRSCSVMRTPIPLAPGEPDVTIHMVLNDFGDLGGRAYVETGEAEADRATIVNNILSGQYSSP